MRSRRGLCAAAMAGTCAASLFVALPAFADEIPPPVSFDALWYKVVTQEVCEDDPIYGHDCWEDDENVPIFHIEDGGSYAVTLGEAHPFFFTALPPYYPDSNSRLPYTYSAVTYRIMSDGSGEIVDPDDEGNVSFPAAGSYELRIYGENAPLLNLAPKTHSILALLGIGVAEAWGVPVLVETIHFSITDANANTPPPCCSSVVFIPGIKGSVLETGGDTLWPPSVWSDDIPRLALNTDGSSVNDVRVAGILKTFDIGPIHAAVYAPFADFLDSLVAQGTIAEWVPLAYDWRYAPDQILQSGVAKADGAHLDIIQEIEDAASRSRTGKVAIVAHSMGGLLGKEIIRKLQDLGKDDIVESFTMVGSPQLGTPQAIATLLHGDGEGIGAGFVVDPAASRAVALNMPSAYELLPSSGYFNAVNDPVIVFDPAAAFTAAWRGYWGDSITSYAALAQFAEGRGVPRNSPPASLLSQPAVLRQDLLHRAEDSHIALDGYHIPDHIRVVQIAGWGRPTAKAVEYTTEHFDLSGFHLPAYDVEFTAEGDGTVVYPSAISSLSDEDTYFFNMPVYRKSTGIDSQHKDILSEKPVQSVVSDVIEDNQIDETDSMTRAKPAANEDMLDVSTHSPVLLGAYDEAGNFTGVQSGQDASSGVFATQEGIPGSSFVYTADSQHIFLPEGGTYRFVYSGTGSGQTSVSIAGFSGDSETPIATYSDIPTTAQTTASFTVEGDDPAVTEIFVDVDGDGSSDTIVAPDGSAPSIADLLALIRQHIGELSVKEKVKQRLLDRIDTVEKRLRLTAQKNARVLANFESRLATLTKKGRVDATSATEISALLGALEAQVGIVPLDGGILSQLQEKIGALDARAALKAGLRARVQRLENVRALAASLANTAAMIGRIAAHGKLSDADAQTLTNIMSQIQDAI